MRAGRNDGIIVLPTGAGKTALMLCVAKEGRGATILFSPVVALKQDIERRAKDAGVKLELYSVETAHTMLEQLAKRQDLGRIIFDEAHLVLTHASFRDFSALKLLKALNVPSILLTATLPAKQEAELAAAFLMYSHHLIRARTNRPNLKYAVMQGDVLSYVQGLVLTGEDRTIVFWRRIEEVKYLKDVLQAAYCIGPLSEAEKLEQVKSRRPIIVCTSAFGAGIDYAHVRHVVHTAEPELMMEYVQESCRAGRDGRVAHSVIFRQGLRTEMVLDGCRRAEIGRVMDGYAYECVMARENEL